MKLTSTEQNNVFPVILRQEEDGGYFVVNPAFEGCYSQGDTIEDALSNIKEVTEICLEEAQEGGKKTIIPNVSLHMIHA